MYIMGTLCGTGQPIRSSGFCVDRAGDLRLQLSGESRGRRL